MEKTVEESIEQIRSNSMMEIYQGIIGIDFIDEKDREKIFPAVVELFDYPDRRIKSLAIKGFAQINIDKSRDILIDLLNDPETRKGKKAHAFQEEAIIALGKFNDPIVIDFLKKLFTTHYPRDSFNKKRKLIIIRALSDIAVHNDDALNTLREYSKIKEFKKSCDYEIEYVLDEREIIEKYGDG